MEASGGMGATTIMMLLLFGTNAILYVIFMIVKFYTKQPVTELANPDKNKKELAKPFLGTIECFTNLTGDLFMTGLIMGLTYICENHWIFEHSAKFYSRDLFLFVLIIFFAYGIYTIKPVQDLTLLGREQTEEWKGWMQFIFLLYHYFHAEEAYNSVRVMITCYVWMTGFGNFSFFYIKQDFGWLRVFQMFWRLNFSVLLLMWTHGNTYILYYICPMHTFYFLMVYATMYVYSSVNTSKWGIRWKLMVVGLLIFLIWDVNGGLFDLLFAWLGTEKTIGANYGSVWEYYFRTSLDHWSSFLGMIFAVNFPLAEQYFHKAREGSGWSLWVAAALMGALALWWLAYCYPLDKLEYNLTHAYFSIIPLTAYIFFRNLTPRFRSGVSQSMHDLGKTTLETYLLQHHIWLTSNAKTLLTIVPEHPWINFALATLLFFFVSKELYRLTMSLRGMVIPDDKGVAWNNCLGMGAIVGLLYVLGHAVHGLGPSWATVLLSCLALALVALLLIGRFTRNADHPVYHLVSTRAVMVTGVLALVVGTQMMFSHSAAAGSSALSASRPYAGNSAECLDSVSRGHWVKVRCAEPTAAKPSKSAYCSTDQWVWDAEPGCPVGKFDLSRLRGVFKGKKLLFVGDSSVRSAYHQFISAVDPGYSQNHSAAFKHSDIQHSPAFDRNMSLSFVWAPLIDNVTAVLTQTYRAPGPKPSMIVCGAAYWDALYVRDVQSYAAKFGAMVGTVAPMASAAAKSTVNVWLLPTTVLDDHLPTADKQQFMTEAVVGQYREAVRSAVAASRTSSAGGALFQTVVDPTAASLSREAGSSDGVHYGEEVYQVVAHMLANAYSLHFPAVYAKGGAASGAAKKPYVPKKTGSMSSPVYGAAMLALSFAMLFLMDSFLGAGYLSLALFGKSLDYDEAYRKTLEEVRRNALAIARSNQGAHAEPPVAARSTLANEAGTAAEEEALL